MKKIAQNKSGFSVVELLIILVVVGLIGAAGYFVYNRSKKSQTSTTPTQTTETTNTESSSTDLTFESGFRLEPDTFGVAKGKPVADVSAIKLSDGTWRIYAFGQDKGILSAASSDGLTFKAESGSRLGDGAGMPRVLKLSNGKTRMYFIDAGGIGSAISSDGLKFAKESGMRISAPSGESAITGPSTPVKLSDGKWHAYFSGLPKPGEGLKAFKVYSAISSDLVNWTVQSGVRLGGGKVVSSAEHPDAAVNSNGEVVLYFFVNDTKKLMTATSKDGVTFSDAKETGLDCNDPNIVQVSGEQYRIYCGDFDESIGGVVKSALAKLPN